MPLDASTKLKRSDQVTFQNVAGEAILIRLDTGTYFSLNKTGTEFWGLLDGERTIEEHAITLAEKNNAIVQAAVEGVHRLAESIQHTYPAEAQVLVDELQAFARSLDDRYRVATSLVVNDLLELAGQMMADRLVNSV